HRPLFEWHLVERTFEDPRRFTIHRGLFRGATRRGDELGLDAERRSMPRKAAVVGRESKDEGKEPRTDRPRHVVAAEVRVDDDEDVVSEIFEIAGLNAEAPE